MSADEGGVIGRVAEALTPDARVTVLTGAGVSAASGVPTFRGAGGLWGSEARDIDAATEAARCDVFFAIGTAAVVHPAAGLIDLARSHGAMTIEINPEATVASGAADVVITAGAESALPAIDAMLGPRG